MLGHRARKSLPSVTKAANGNGGQNHNFCSHPRAPAQPGQSVPQGERTRKKPEKNAGPVHNSINIKCQHNWE